MMYLNIATTWAYAMSFNVSEVPEWVLHYQNIWNEVESYLLEKLGPELRKEK